MLDHDLRENAVIRGLIEQARQEGKQEGRQEAIQEAMLLELLAAKLGSLPEWTFTHVQQATGEQLTRWTHQSGSSI